MNKEAQKDYAHHLADLVVGYLMRSGWYRDGDDPGIWINDNFSPRGNYDIGEAFVEQLVKDGLEWPYV